MQFKCKNSSDYKLQASDNLQVTVSHKTSRAVLPHAVEPARLVGEERVKISFTARLSGDYSVEIKLNGFLVGSNGVINRHYKPGIFNCLPNNAYLLVKSCLACVLERSCCNHTVPINSNT